MSFLLKNYSRAISGLMLLLTVLMLMASLGCRTSTSMSDSDTASATVDSTATNRPARTPTTAATQNNSTPTISVSEEETEATVQNLTLWMVEQISPEVEGRPGRFVRDTLRAFRRSNSNTEIEVLIKKPSGKGGTLDFLRTAREVAPTVLPDIAILNATDLNQAAAENLIQPLDGRLDRSIVQDLIPAARKMGTINDQLMGVPIGLEMEHTVYNGLVFETAPLLWHNVLTAETKYLFPAKGVNGLVNDLTLAQYFSAGGRLLDDEGQPMLDEGVLEDVLRFYQQALESETIDASVLEAATTEELWPIYVERQAGLAQITVRQFLTDREILINTNFTPLPVQAPQDTPVSITHGWVLVLVTDSAELPRQAAALDLMEWFLSTSNNVAWSEINKSIPSRDTAYQQLAGDDPYWVFLAEQLNMAQPEPGFDGYNQLGRIVQQAVEQVISGEATPEEATATARDAITQ